MLGHYTDLSSKNVANPNFSAGDSYGSKIGGEVMWREPRSNRFFLGYEIRHNGERQDIQLGGSPIGDKLPAFTVHNLRGGARIGTVGSTTASVMVAVLNLGERALFRGVQHLVLQARGPAQRHREPALRLLSIRSTQRVPVRDGIEGHREAPLGLPAPEGSDGEVDHMPLAERRVDHRGLPGQFLPAHQQARDQQ